MGDSNFFIEKLTAQDHTTTTVTKLTVSGKIKEIARLIGGAEITAATIAAAKDMCIQADNLKALAKVH
jgi:DNA repair protein RecN (Recombination protein N)